MMQYTYASTAPCVFRFACANILKDNKMDHKKRNIKIFLIGLNFFLYQQIPVGLSISVTYISAITVIGFPAETYLFGTVMFWFGVSSLIPNIVACIYYIPLIHRLRLETINEVKSFNSF